MAIPLRLNLKEKQIGDFLTEKNTAPFIQVPSKKILRC